MARFLHQYTAIPDGTECHRKAAIATGVSGSVGLYASAFSVALNPAGSILEGVARMGRYTFTAATVGAMFSLGSCLSAQVREQPDDPLNYFIGGCAGGLALGARNHSYGVATVGCVCMGTTAALLKLGQLEGWELFPKPRV